MAKKMYNSPSFLGTQSKPKVNFLIWITRWSGNEAKRVVLRHNKHTEEMQRLTEMKRSIINYFVAVVLACTAELQKSVSVSGSLRAAKQAANGIWARVTAGGGAPVDSASSRRRSASCSSSDKQEEKMINERKDKTMETQMHTTVILSRLSSKFSMWTTFQQVSNPY